jgi:hypothetical protein
VAVSHPALIFTTSHGLAQPQIVTSLFCGKTMWLPIMAGNLTSAVALKYDKFRREKINMVLQIFGMLLFSNCFF